MLRPAGTGKTVVNVRLNKANASIQNLLDRISEAEGITPDKLKQQGKTVVAVTHDDRWFASGDRLIKLEYGKIVEESLTPEDA